MRTRLQKLLAEAGLASRRGAEALIRAGRVRVNGHTAGLGDSADPASDDVRVDGRPLRLETKAYWLVHKPRGVVTTRADPGGRRTVLDLLPPAARRLRLYPVGRLDLDSEGLVLLTNDGALAQRLLHPSFESEKEYAVEVRGAPTDEALRRLAEGFALERGERPTAPADVARTGGARSGAPEARSGAREALSGARTRLRVVLHEGRKRQLRRAFEALGHPVERLVRVRIGPLRLRGLAAGEARAATPGECAALERHARGLTRHARDRPRHARDRPHHARRLASPTPRQLPPEPAASAADSARPQKARLRRRKRDESR